MANNRERLIVALVVALGGLMLGGCGNPSKQLSQAILSEDIDKAKSILQDHPEIVNKSEQGIGYPLMEAAAAKQWNIVRLLLAKGADVNVNDHGHTVLHYAAEQGNREMVILLLTKGADLNTKGRYGHTPLHRALHEGHKEIAETLISKGASVNAKDYAGATPLHYSAFRSYKDVNKLLFKLGCSIGTEIHDAAVLGNLDEIRSLLASNPQLINAKDEAWEYTPLCCSAANGHKDIVEFLITKGADVNTKGKHRSTPLGNAAFCGHREVVELLIANGAEINPKSRLTSSTPLHRAILGGNETVVKILIANGANVNTKDKSGDTPLDLARENRHNDIADLLRKHGAKE